MKHKSEIKDLSWNEIVEVQDFMPQLSVDCTIFGYHDKSLKVLVMKYHDLDLWALPGGFIYKNEDLRKAAERILFQRTNLQDLFLDQFHTFGRLERNDTNIPKILLKNKGVELNQDHWIFERFITVAYCSLVDYTLSDTFPDALHESCSWFEVNKLPDLAFDHRRIIEVGLKHLQKNLDTQIVASKLLPEKFTMNQLQGVYEAVLGETFRRNNFQRKMLSLNTLERMEKLYDGSANKAPYLYRFIESEINFLD